MLRSAREPCSARMLARALRAHAAPAGVALDLSEWQSRPWSSVLFTGHRHRVTATTAAPGPGWDAWLASLAEADLSLPRCYVADLAVTRLGDGAELAALVLDE